jgi:nucleoside-diphosphate-sugar epimerase
MSRICVTGAGGMIGGFMASRLVGLGHEVIAVDIKPLYNWLQVSGTQVISLDLNDYAACDLAVRGCDEVFDFACQMGGIGYIETYRAECAMSIVMTANMLRAAASNGVKKLFKSSSACVYRADKQTSSTVTALKEEDAWPAQPERGYGLEKLYGEELCELVREDFGLETRIGRYHNIYSGGPTTYKGGREKAPAAICRKVATAVLSGDLNINIWGDGEQTRSFCWIEDCLDGTLRLMESDYPHPLNIGSDELVSINDLVTIFEEIAGVKLHRTYDLSAPKGVRGRNSDNSLVKEVLGWHPTTSLRNGLEHTYAWVFDQVRADLGV